MQVCCTFGRNLRIMDSDGWPDLVVAGEWMPVKIFLNQKRQICSAAFGTMMFLKSKPAGGKGLLC